jgi:cardiolipin synthase (CMP-forming)
VAERRLTFRRLSGLDRSGPPPPETQAGAPLNPWTIPNAIGFARLALIPVFVIVAFSTENGTGTWPAVLFAFIAWTDYADGIAARVTGQYSRLGTLLDPLTDRMLVVAGAVVCWNFELLPRWALGVLALRELAMLVLSRLALTHGLDIRINWPGRLAVWPLMSALFFALVDLLDAAEVLLYIGLVLSLWATALYVRDARREVSTRG